MRPLKNLCEVAVIGGGLAGLSAARHAARLGHLVTLYEGTGMYGGQVATVDHVDGLPMPGAQSGQDLAIPMLEGARMVGVRVIESEIVKIDLGDRITMTDSEGKSWNPAVVIVASGSSLRKLGVPNEDEFTGRGVSRCATCDGGFFRGQDVVVVGGGDAAVHEALVLARMSRKVTMICRSPLRAKREYLDILDARENVDFIWDSEVSEILGDGEVSGVRLRNLRGGGSTDVACSGVFPFIGGVPNTGFLSAKLLTKSGHVKAGADLVSADKRVFAVGAARAHYGGNAVQAMAEGIGAAEAAVRLIEGRA